MVVEALVLLVLVQVVVLLRSLFESAGRHSERRGAAECDAVRLSVPADDPARWSRRAASREPAILMQLPCLEGSTLGMFDSVRRDERRGRGCSQLRRHLQDRIKQASKQAILAIWSERRAASLVSCTTAAQALVVDVHRHRWIWHNWGPAPEAVSEHREVVEFDQAHRRPCAGSCGHLMPTARARRRRELDRLQGIRPAMGIGHWAGEHAHGRQQQHRSLTRRRSAWTICRVADCANTRASRSDGAGLTTTRSCILALGAAMMGDLVFQPTAGRVRRNGHDRKTPGRSRFALPLESVSHPPIPAPVPFSLLEPRTRVVLVNSSSLSGLVHTLCHMVHMATRMPGGACPATSRWSYLRITPWRLCSLPNHRSVAAALTLPLPLAFLRAFGIFV